MLYGLKTPPRSLLERSVKGGEKVLTEVPISHKRIPEHVNWGTGFNAPLSATLPKMRSERGSVQQNIEWTLHFGRFELNELWVRMATQHNNKTSMESIWSEKGHTIGIMSDLSRLVM